MIPAALRALYDNAQPNISHVAAKVRATLVAFTEKHHGYAFLDRHKTLASLTEKLETGRYASWSNIDDLYAATLVVPTLLDEAEVHAYIRDRFAVQREALRGTTFKTPQEFRFDSPRFYCKLKAPAGLETEPIYQVLFEIQTHTAFEHAWGVTTHRLSYKALAIDWRARRVAAQLRATVEQMDTLILTYDALVKNVIPSKDDTTDVQALISSTIVSWEQRGFIPATSLPLSVARCAENIYSLFSGVRRDERIPRVLAALAAADAWFSDASIPFPTSISVFQIFVGICSDFSMLLPNERYTLFSSSELESLFPAVVAIKKRFQY